MRLENYSVASFDDGGVLADDTPVAEASPAAEPAPSAPSTLLSEMAQQPPLIRQVPPPAPPVADAAPSPAPPPLVKPLADAATAAPTPAAAPPTWQGMTLAGAAPAVPGLGPGIDAATFARIEAAGHSDSGAHGSGGGGFGFGFGGFGGGGDSETWDYTFEGMDGAPDTTVSVTYQGDSPVSSQTTTSFGGGDTSVSEVPQEVITLPASAPPPDFSADLPAGIDSSAAAAPTPTAPPATTGTGIAPAPVAPGATGGNAPSTATDGAAPSSSTGTTAAAGPATAAAAAPPASTQDPYVLGQNSNGQDIRAVGSYQPQGPIRVVSDAPTLRAGDPSIGADATGATPMRDDAGTLLYRIDGGKDDGVIRQLLPPATAAGTPPELPVEHLDPVVITGHRDPNASVADTTPDAPDQASGAALALGAVSLAGASAGGNGALARLAPVARAVLTAELEFGPPQLKAIALGSLAAGAALAAWQARNGNAGRDMLTPEEQAAANQPLINVPPPAEPSGVPPLAAPTPGDDAATTLPGTPIDGPQLPPIEHLPIADPVTLDDTILTRDGRDAKELGDNLTAAGQPKPGVGYQPHHKVPVAAGGPEMAALREKLAALGIDINDAANGVWLPGPASDPNAPEAYHPRLNNGEYNAAVIDAFRDVTTAADARLTLDRIGNSLQQGDFPGVRPRP